MSSTVSRSTAQRAVCHRHPRHVWIASCPDCTSWHLAGLRAGRDERSAAPGPRDARGDRVSAAA
jgi:hypothetical protein